MPAESPTGAAAAERPVCDDLFHTLMDAVEAGEWQYPPKVADRLYRAGFRRVPATVDEDALREALTEIAQSCDPGRVMPTPIALASYARRALAAALAAKETPPCK